MKAQERHELRENDLASWLQYGLWAFLKTYGSYVLLTLSLCFLGFQLWNLYSRKQQDARNQAWIDFNTLQYRENLPDYVLSTIMRADALPFDPSASPADRKDATTNVAAA